MRNIRLLATAVVLFAPMVASAQESTSDVIFWRDDGEINVRVSTKALERGSGLMQPLAEGEHVVRLLWQGPGPSYVEAKVDPRYAWVILADLPTGSSCEGGDVKVKGLARGNFIAQTNKRELFFNVQTWDTEPSECAINGDERITTGGICRDQFTVVISCLEEYHLE